MFTIFSAISANLGHILAMFVSMFRITAKFGGVRWEISDFPTLRRHVERGLQGQEVGASDSYEDTLWLFNIAMENGPFTDDFPIKTFIYGGFSMAMLNNQMVFSSFHTPIFVKLFPQGDESAV